MILQLKLVDHLHQPALTRAQEIRAAANGRLTIIKSRLFVLEVPQALTAHHPAIRAAMEYLGSRDSCKTIKE